MITWQSIAKITLSSLLSCLVIILITLLWSIFNVRSFHRILSSRKRVVYAVFLVLFLAIPTAFSLSRGEFLSSKVVVTYVRELLVSITFVFTFIFTWNLLNDPIATKKAVLSRWLLAELSLIAGIFRVTGSPKRLPYLFRHSMARLRTLLEISEQQPSLYIQSTTVRRLIDAIGPEQLNKEYLWLRGLFRDSHFETFRQIGQSVGITLKEPRQFQKSSASHLWGLTMDRWRETAPDECDYSWDDVIKYVQQAHDLTVRESGDRDLRGLIINSLAYSLCHRNEPGDLAFRYNREYEHIVSRSESEPEFLYARGCILMGLALQETTEEAVRQQYASEALDSLEKACERARAVKIT